MKKCTICQKPIVLIPSAQERAKRFGGNATYYESLFTQHPECAVEKRSQATSMLMKQIATDAPQNVVVARFTVENGSRIYTNV